MKTWRMRIACWIPKSKNTHTYFFAILIAFPRQFTHPLHICLTSNILLPLRISFHVLLVISVA